MEKKYQWSKFIGENRDEQVVIRTDNWEEFKEAKDNIDSLFFFNETKEEQPITDTRPQAVNKTEKPQSVVEYQKSCPQCGAEKVLNPKTGKWFCKDKCWLKPV